MNKKIKSIFASALIFSIITTGCKDNDTNKSKEIHSDESTISSESEISDLPDSSQYQEETSENPQKEIQTSSGEYNSVINDIFSENDVTPSYNADTEIILNDLSSEINGEGAEFNNSVVTISEGGSYKISGELNDGQIIVNSSEKVWLILDSVNIHCSYSSPIYIQQSDKTFITLAKNSINNLSDGSEYKYTSDEENEPDAVIFSKDNITFNGEGTLNVSANFNEGITSKDDITITGGTINIKSVGNGIKGKDCVALTSCQINIESKSDGIKSSNIDETGKGFIFIKDGNINITSEEDCLHAEQEIIISDGTISLISGGGSTSENVSFMPEENFDRGRSGFFDNFNETTQTSDTDNEISRKGIKSGNLIYISGGEISIDSSDDALHTNGSLKIQDGKISISSGDDGIHADSSIYMNNGKVDITNSYEGVESAIINISGGEISLVSTDDGFNASNGSSQGSMGQKTEGVNLIISGGLIYVNANGDGIDSNGDMMFEGGTIIVDGPVSNGNGSLDSNSSISMEGGTLISVGSIGMVEYPSDTSSQKTLGLNVQNQKENTCFTICDSSGNEIVTYKPSKAYSSIIVSTPQLKEDETYTLYLNSTSSSSENYGFYKNGGYNNDGTENGTYNTGNYSSQRMIGNFHGEHGNGHMIPPDDEIPPDFNPPADFQTPPDFIPENIPPEFNHQDFTPVV